MSKRWFTLALAFLFLTAGCVLPTEAAVPSNLTTAMIYTASDGTSLPYQLYVPDPAKVGDKPLSLLIYLHGAGERGNDNISPSREDCDLLIKIMRHPADYPCVVIIPQCAENAKWVDTPWERGSYSVQGIRMSRYLRAVKELADSLVVEQGVDPGRQYVTGLSMGGFGTWDLIMRYPRTYAAAIPVCGGADPSQAPRLRHIAIRTYHGSADPTVPVSGTREMAAAMEAAGSPLFSYTEMEGRDHGIWGDVYRQKDLADWLFGQVRRDIGTHWGDIDDNDAVNAADALIALQHSVMLTTLMYEDFSVADVNADRDVNAADALLILQKSVRLIERFPAEPDQPEETEEKPEEADGMTVTLNGTPVSVVWEENAATAALRERTADGPVTVDLTPYGGFEQVGPLGFSLPRDDQRLTTEAGDLCLYAGDQITLFLAPNTWSYTKLGRVTAPTGDELAALLGADGTTMVIE